MKKKMQVMANSPLHIEVKGLGKKYYQRWLFRDISIDLTEGSKLAVIGKNGSGKSTLLRIISGQTHATEGQIAYSVNDQALASAQIYRYLSWAGPHVELYQDLTWEEHVQLHFRFCQCVLARKEDIHELLNLSAHRSKKLRFFSSGMLQRATVGLALFSKSQVLMLDEPTSHLDEENADLLLGLIRTYLDHRIYILASNMKREFEDIPQRLYLTG